MIKGVGKWRWYFTNMLLIGQAIAFLVHFSWIVRYGGVTIMEPNPVMLWAEIAALVGILTLGVTNIMIGERRRKHDKRRL